MSVVPVRSFPGFSTLVRLVSSRPTPLFPDTRCPTPVPLSSRLVPHPCRPTFDILERTLGRSSVHSGRRGSRRQDSPDARYTSSTRRTVIRTNNRKLLTRETVDYCGKPGGVRKGRVDVRPRSPDEVECRQKCRRL